MQRKTRSFVFSVISSVFFCVGWNNRTVSYYQYLIMISLWGQFLTIERNIWLSFFFDFIKRECIPLLTFSIDFFLYLFCVFVKIYLKKMFMFETTPYTLFLLICFYKIYWTHVKLQQQAHNQYISAYWMHICFRSRARTMNVFRPCLLTN